MEVKYLQERAGTEKIVMIEKQQKMKRLNELLASLLKIQRIAAAQSIVIHEVGLDESWFSSPTEMAPDKLLGIKIT